MFRAAAAHALPPQCPAQVLLYTERAQFYNRHRIRGAKVGCTRVGCGTLRLSAAESMPRDRPAQPAALMSHHLPPSLPLALCPPRPSSPSCSTSCRSTPSSTPSCSTCWRRGREGRRPRVRGQREAGICDWHTVRIVCDWHVCIHLHRCGRRWTSAAMCPASWRTACSA